MRCFQVETSTPDANSEHADEDHKEDDVEQDGSEPEAGDMEEAVDPSFLGYQRSKIHHSNLLEKMMRHHLFLLLLYVRVSKIGCARKQRVGGTSWLTYQIIHFARHAQ